MEETQKDILSSTLKQFASELSTPVEWIFKKPPKIKLTDLINKKINLKYVRNVIYNLIDKDMLFNTDRNIIIYHSLKCFNFKKYTININKPISIENGCKKILKLLDIFKQGEDVLSTYFTEILDLEELPYKEKLRLEKKVKNDLKTIDDLIKSYEHEKCVIDYKSKNQIGRNQMERIYIEFYKRCLDEKEKMVNYLIYNLEEKALKLSKIHSLDRLLYIGWIFHPPYRFLTKRNMEFFDWFKINKCRHKIPDDLIIKEINNLENIYNDGRYELFYTKLKKILPLDKLFKNINDKISKFPELSKRKKIITELEFLFRKKKWYGFYALALTQVEGIFFEMVDLVYSRNKGLSLPDKVNALRKYYRYHEYTFDYYEFYLPIQRNRFFHTGKVSNLVNKSYGLLYDLNALLNIFYELDTPLVELSNMIDRENEEDFQKIIFFNHFYYLIHQVKQKGQIMQIESRLNNFIDNFILSKVDLMTIYIKLYYEIKLSFEKLFELLEGYYYEETKSKINLCKSSNDQLIEKLSTFKSIFENNKYRLEDDIKFLMDSQEFLKNTKKFLKKIPKDAEIFQELIEKNFNNNFEKLKLFVNNLKLSDTLLKPFRLK